MGHPRDGAVIAALLSLLMRVPRPVPGCDIRSLPLKPAEAYVLSRVDGAASDKDLSSMTGLPPENVAEALDRLVELGAIEFATEAAVRPLFPDQSGGGYHSQAPGARSASWGPRQSGVDVDLDRRTTPAPPPVELAATSTAPRRHPTPQTGVAVAQTHVMGRGALDTTSGSPPLYDPADLDEDVEIDPERRRRILDLFYRLDDYTYYELLNVSEAADKKQVKSAYYLLAPEFHPDKFFRKRLGSYKQKIEAIFTRVTLAHDVLTARPRREEYDEYLAQTHKNRTMSALLEQSARDIAAVESALDEQARAIAGSPSAPPPSPGRYAPETLPPLSMQARREILAKKLMGGARPGTTTPPPAPTAKENAQAAAESLRARFEWARAEAMRQQIGRYVESGRTALDRKDYAAAANAFRIAASLSPEDMTLQQTAEEVAKQAAVALAAGFLKQAEYEASHNRWSEASLSFAKAAAGMPDNARVHERVAVATLKASGNARRAIEFARKAVEMAPKEPEYRITLARAYLAAGLEKSADGELDRAHQLAPKDARIRDMIKLARQQPTSSQPPSTSTPPKAAPSKPEAGEKGDKKATN